MATPGAKSVLKALDVAKTQTYHFKAILIAGMGFFTDAYDLFSIGYLVKLLGRIYYTADDAKKPGVLPIRVNAAVIGTALSGTLVGQLFFGWLGDRFGRKKVYGITLALMVIASIGQGLSIHHSPNGVIATLCIFRFILGFGIGGDYPLSATIMSEYSNTRTRGSFVAAVFAMQGFGILAAAIVILTIVSIFDSRFPRPPFKEVQKASTPPEADWVWRIVLMMGAIPAALTFYSRYQMPETARFTALIQKNERQAALDMEKVLHTTFDHGDQLEVRPEAAKAAAGEYSLFSPEFARRHGKELLGTCLTWFLFDIAFYSQNLFQPNVLSSVHLIPAPTEMSALEETYRNARAQAIIAVMSTVPGYWFTVIFIDRVGRKKIQLMGFAFMSVFLYILPFTMKQKYAFIILYALTFFFCNFGPNATTFIVPAELFPARLRSTCHGISSAVGKAGAIVGSFGFLYASQPIHEAELPDGYKKGIGLKGALLLLAVCSTLGFVVTVFCTPETMGRSLEGLSGEDQDELSDGGQQGFKSVDAI